MRRSAAVLSLLVCQSPRALPAQSTPGEGAVLDALEARARDALGAIDHATDRASWERLVPVLRKKLLASLGIDRLGKPAPRNIRTVGSLDRGDYLVEKLTYEALPGVEVPAHLYLPKAEGRRPAILFVPGHWYADSKAKTDFQAFAISMARWGFAILVYDPFGQGERGISLRDHRRTELLPVGVAQQAITAFESFTALELLLSRPEVDPDRIGMTGASGGGYNTWIVTSLDSRIAAAGPVVGTSEFHEQLSVVRARDWYDAKEHCHFIPGLLRYANNHEFVAMVAPRPLLIVAAHNDDSFRIPGNRRVAEYGRSLYRALGAADRLGYVEDELEGHGYQKKKREAAYGWFRKWLQGEGDGALVAEPPLEIPPPEAPELRCFPDNRSSGPGLVALAKSLVAMPFPDPARLKGSLIEALGLGLLPRLTASSKLEREGPRVRWTMRDDVEIPGLLLEPPGDWKGALVACADAGKESLREHIVIRGALAQGHAVLLADPRGMGELATSKPGWTFAVSLLLGENFAGRQAMDLVGGWRALYALPALRGRPVAVFGSGPYASMAALYSAVLEPRISGLVSEGGFATYRSFIERPRTFAESCRLLAPGQEASHRVDPEIPSALILFDALRRFDVPDLVRSLAPRPVAILSTIDGDFESHLGSDLGGFFGRLAVLPHPEAPIGSNASRPVERGRFPNRVHAVEDYETDIEKRWWMAGRLETREIPPGCGRACRGTLANDFDDRMGDPSRIYTAVIFNPVPGPPMGKNPRLSFRYRLKGCSNLRVQIYSLTKGYHRHLTLENMAQGSWQSCAVDMTAARRPDGSGGPLSEGERIDDIQFYTDPAAELLIDDIVLYDAADSLEDEPWPKRILFTGWFDTGRQGREWPGSFDLIPAYPGRKGARSVACPDGGTWIRLGLRGSRSVRSGSLRLRCRTKRSGEGGILPYLVSSGNLVGSSSLFLYDEREEWSKTRIDFAGVKEVEEIRFLRPRGGDFLVSDVVLYEPCADR